MSDNEQKTQVAFIVSGIVIAEFLCACLVSASLFHEPEPKLNDNETVIEEVEEENNDIYYKEIKSIIDDINSAEEDFKKVVTNRNVKTSLKEEAFYYFYKKLEKTKEKIYDSENILQYFSNEDSSNLNGVKFTEKRNRYYFSNPETQLYYVAYRHYPIVSINYEYLKNSYSGYLSKPYQEFISLHSELEEIKDLNPKIDYNSYDSGFLGIFCKIWYDYLMRYPNKRDLSELVKNYSDCPDINLSNKAYESKQGSCYNGKTSLGEEVKVCIMLSEKDLDNRFIKNLKYSENVTNKIDFYTDGLKLNNNLVISGINMDIIGIDNILIFVPIVIDKSWQSNGLEIGSVLRPMNERDDIRYYVAGYVENGSKDGFYQFSDNVESMYYGSCGRSCHYESFEQIEYNGKEYETLEETIKNLREKIKKSEIY